MKGIREIASGLVLGVLLVTGHRRALGWVLWMQAVAPFGDMINVLAHHGSTAAAFGIHGLISALMVVIGLLILRETSKARKVRKARETHETIAPAPAARPV